jgi:HD-like signal output (HDOD) protein
LVFVYQPLDECVKAIHTSTCSIIISRGFTINLFACSKVPTAKPGDPDKLYIPNAINYTLTQVNPIKAPGNPLLSAPDTESQLKSVEKTLLEINGLISLPEIYLKFRRLMDEPNSNIEDFSAVVSYDPNLTSKVLSLVNSAFFGFPGQIDSISRAINLLGIGQLHDMVLGTSAMATLDLPNDIVPLKTFWRCSLFSGVLARLLAKQLKIRKGERLFVIGLLHEIGHLVMYAKYPEQAKQAIDLFHDGGQMIHVTEQNLLGLHYGQIGAKLMAQWQLPTNFQEMTHYQPTPANALEYPLETTLLHLAHGYAHKLYHDTEQTLEQLIIPDAWKILDLLPDQIESTLDTALQACSDMEKFILK